MGVLAFDTKRVNLSGITGKSSTLLICLVLIMFMALFVRPALASGNVADNFMWRFTDGWSGWMYESGTVQGVCDGVAVQASHSSCSGMTCITSNEQTGNFEISWPGHDYYPNYCRFDLGAVKLNVCPAHASGTPATNPTSCTCNTNYQPDSTATSCVPAAVCPVDKLTTLPFNDACAEVLENISSTQAQKDAACGALTPALQAGEACLAGKLFSMSPAIPLVITSDIRDVAYQAHFREIWDKMEELVRLMKNDPAMQTACATRRAEIAAEKGCDKAGPCKSKKDEVCYAESATQRSHCLIGRPANPNPDDAQHTSGNAFDVSRTYTINPLQAALGALRPPETIPQFLDAPPTNCNLNWGGTFTDNYDPIHFYVR